MTASTEYLRRARSEFVFFSCALILILGSSAVAQAGIHSPGTILPIEDTTESSAYLSSNEAQDPCSPALPAGFGRTAAAQTETNPKPHAPILSALEGVSTSAMGGYQAGSSVDALRFPSRFPTKDRFEIPAMPDQNWQPLPPPRRFSPSDGETVPTDGETVSIDDPDPKNGVSEKFHWRSAVLQSIMIQSVQHAYAVTIQEKTRREFKGPWLKDWFRSVRNIHGWSDGNRFFTNYIAHPMQGGMTGFIYLQNHDRLKRQKFAESKTYWVDRLKAMAWSAAWSTQWEIGPFSQAAIGNVGLKKGMAFVDLVVTPTVGTAWMILEEALDRYIIRHLEKRSNVAVRMLLRSLLNPMRGVANTLRFKEPWHRDRPFGT